MLIHGSQFKKRSEKQSIDVSLQELMLIQEECGISIDVLKYKAKKGRMLLPNNDLKLIL